ncbi:hypothetical protein ACQR16_26605 [Bradyrhizobium oligotrophicum]|uniref:hypothetical protein n=1 Tax=Bradyrhizobium oligotrophicum TaxID=44255 RepID=UPI003EB70947
MRLWAINELMLLTRDELCRLADELEQGLNGLEPGTVLRLDALKRPSSVSRSPMQIDNCRCEAAIRSDPVRHVIDGERADLVYAQNLALDLVVESLEGLRAS